MPRKIKSLSKIKKLSLILFFILCGCTQHGDQDKINTSDEYIELKLGNHKLLLKKAHLVSYEIADEQTHGSQAIIRIPIPESIRKSPGNKYLNILIMHAPAESTREIINAISHRALAGLDEYNGRVLTYDKKLGLYEISVMFISQYFLSSGIDKLKESDLVGLCTYFNRERNDGICSEYIDYNGLLVTIGIPAEIFIQWKDTRDYVSQFLKSAEDGASKLQPVNKRM